MDQFPGPVLNVFEQVFRLSVGCVLDRFLWQLVFSFCSIYHNETLINLRVENSYYIQELLYSKCPEQCLAHDKTPVNLCQ